MALLLLLLILSSALLFTAAAESSSPTTMTRLAFRPRQTSSSSTSTSSLHGRRRLSTNRSSPTNYLDEEKNDHSNIQCVSVFRRKRKAVQTIVPPPPKQLHGEVSQTPPPPPSLDELRAALGPIGLLVSNGIELTVVTLGSYISGACLGYVGGGVMSIPSTIFGKEITGNALRRLVALHRKAMTSCKSWASLSASFTGFNTFVRLCRGDDRDDDGWNAVWGSALTGAFLNRGGGIEAMLRGGATYAGFTLILDRLFMTTTPSSTNADYSIDDEPLF